ncbi:MAG: holo-ACP synthase [Thermodesulfobacteriota bacterium]
MTGIDIVSIERVRKACLRPAILERLFTKNELAYAFSGRDPFKRLAGRFAAKEAFLKALGTGLSSGIRWKDVEVVKDPSGRPVVKAVFVAEKILGKRIPHASIAYVKQYAIATVKIE